MAATGKLAGDVVEPTSLCHAPSEVGDDAQREWVAANAGEVFPEQIGSSSEVAGGRGADHFNGWRCQFIWRPLMAIGGCFVGHAETGGGDPKAG